METVSLKKISIDPVMPSNQNNLPTKGESRQQNELIIYSCRKRHLRIEESVAPLHIQESEPETNTYSGAIVEVCMRLLVFYPDIVGFIEEEKDRFPSVKVQYIFNSPPPPKLIMLDDAGQQ
ncbi:Sep15/SelM redox [Parasponia andersonii]|uniref:Selenoprotein F n=1 Tax=Parasponia andersonii TaxID=3476 RepID=A0A2P5DWK8_PARAD|nr:Sep15/SelM redox [Parasponia andersonii]